jgi:hypothetical protein
MLLKLQTDSLGAAYGVGLEVEGNIVGHAGGDIGYSSDVRMDWKPETSSCTSSPAKWQRSLGRRRA